MRNTKRTNKLGATQDGQRVAVYVRTAADDEAGTACQDQVRRVLELVEQPAPPAVYADAGKSGLDANRPGLQRLLADIRQGSLRCVVVGDIARLARNTTLLETILGELRAAGVELVTVEEGKRHA